MDPLSTINNVFDFLAGEAVSDGSELTKDAIKKILENRKLMELLDQFDQSFRVAHDTDISVNNIDMQTIFNQRKDLINLAEQSMAAPFDINVNRKDYFLKRAYEKVGEHSDCVGTYLSGFYDMVFLKESKCVSDEDKVFFNSLADQICKEVNRINREVTRLDKRVGNLENAQVRPFDFVSFYNDVLKEFTEENDDNQSAALVGSISSEKSYIDEYIEIGNEKQPVLLFLNDWFGKKKYGTLLIHGEPGHGKSTLCKKAVFEYIHDRFLKDKAKNVLIVSLNTSMNPDIISKRSVSYQDILVWGPAREIKFTFEDCRGALLFIDGFDEFIDDAVKAEVKEQNIVAFMDHIGRIAKAYDIHIVVLSRTIAVQRHLKESSICRNCFKLALITEPQQNQWINEQGVDAGYKEKFKELQKDKNMSVLLGIPLLFRMIIHTRFDKISSNVVELYNALFDHLMEKREIRDETLEYVKQSLNNLAYEVYCNDTEMGCFKDEEWNSNWVLAFYVKTKEGRKIGFFHRSFYQYFLAKYIYDKLLQVRANNVEDFLGSFAEREIDGTVRKYLSLLIKSKEIKELHDNMGLVMLALARTEAYLNFTPKYASGNATKAKIERSANITRNMILIATSLSYVIQLPFIEGMDTLIRTFGGYSLKLYSEKNNRANLRKADLRRADLSRADLKGADLSEADLSGADLRRADLRKTDLKRTDLRRADLGRADLSGVDLFLADLRGADLRRADLSGATLRGADLRGADLRGADLRRTDLRGAYLRGATLRGADLQVRSLSEMKIDKCYKDMIDSSMVGYKDIIWY